ncbi:putative ABC-class ATPase [Catalinimonas alkaloidigena]|uniref:ABC-ATPase domain-containing protein n=1 Tax=Catalinimonas alkaloidigena TaxID=1075417 RepID=UPI002406B539|nr:ABC-ATPase domain-containing protein [Catalinimonas alkaloidigena]MDF9799624.1 putative ABC-class ATPase [Catalinimonas alkaloidigena]
MKKQEDLGRQLLAIDRKNYKAYKQIRGHYDFGNFSLHIDYVQGDPFASPSQLAIRMPLEETGLPRDSYKNSSRQTALCDYISRVFAQNCRKHSDHRSAGHRGAGHSGKMFMPSIGQEILERNATVLADTSLEVRFNAGLPARGRSVLGRQAVEMLIKDLPQIVQESLYYDALDKRRLQAHIEVAEDADFLRTQLRQMNLVAFIANGAILPRRSGVDDRPMSGQAVPFQSPSSLEVTVDLPNRGKVRGMGLYKGINLIVGGGYHGKSTLLRAISMGVYNHIPGDGREYVATDASAMKIRAEDERSIQKVNISAFINKLPLQQSTEAFSTPSASGSTSQAANIMEALEAGSKLLLIDEDTSATNFMIRDHRMQQLISKEKEPITPFLDKVKQMYHEQGVSTILVMGGSGDYFEVANTVIALEEFRIKDVSEQAKAIAEKYQTQRAREGGQQFGRLSHRQVDHQCLNPEKGKKSVSIKVHAIDQILYGEEKIDVSQIEQLIDQGQLKAIGEAMVYLYHNANGKAKLADDLSRCEQLLNEKGLDALSPKLRGDLVRFRKVELAAAINRFRNLKII